MQSKKNNRAIPTAAALVAVAVLVVAIILATRPEPDLSQADSPQDFQNQAQTTADGDIIIPVGEVSETAKFYAAEIDGTKLEVMAVKAPDGTTRTAFNTCQICYDSGRGYYKQDGDVLVCQNCGNRFEMSQVEVASGGCNPVPIFDENKTVDSENITISADYLKEATVIFANWKTAY